jgi:hypothetical protein
MLLIQRMLSSEHPEAEDIDWHECALMAGMSHGLDAPSVYSDRSLVWRGGESLMISDRVVDRSILVLLGLWRARATFAGAGAFGSYQHCSHCARRQPHQ